MGMLKFFKKVGRSLTRGVKVTLGNPRLVSEVENLAGKIAATYIAIYPAVDIITNIIPTTGEIDDKIADLLKKYSISVTSYTNLTPDQRRDIVFAAAREQVRRSFPEITKDFTDDELDAIVQFTVSVAKKMQESISNSGSEENNGTA